MRKIVANILVVALILTICPLNVSAAANEVNVVIPSFKVTLNGEVMDNEYNKYPLIVYKDITYFPMTYNGARFLGLKANWHEHARRDGSGVLFIGICDKNEKQSTLKLITTAKKNKRHYTATIANYGLLVNKLGQRDLINNTEEKYPILNFRGISYFPLTWKYAVDEFGWKYSFDHKNGLVIDCADPFRPVIDDSNISFTMPMMPKATYVYSDNYYLVVPYYPYDKDTNLVYRKRGGKEKVYNLSDDLKAGKYNIEYLNMEKDVSDGYDAGFKESTPVINGNILSLKCKGFKKEDDPNNPDLKEVLIKIDLDTGKIVSETLQ